MIDIELDVCEDCGDDIPKGEGCVCDGHRWCASCFVHRCPECRDALADDHAAELAMERER